MHKLSDDTTRFVYNSRGVLLAILVTAGFVIDSLSKRSGPTEGKSTTPAMEGTAEIQRATDTVKNSIGTTQDLQDEIEYARVKALFDKAEAESKAKQKTNEEILTSYKGKIAEDPDYTATDVEIEALARLGYGVVGKDGGGSIPFEGDGREKDRKEKK